MAISIDEVERIALAYTERETVNRFNGQDVLVYITELDNLLGNFFLTLVCPSFFLMIRGWLKRLHYHGHCVGHDSGYTTPCVLCRNSGEPGKCWLNLYSLSAATWYNDWFTADAEESKTYWEERAAAALSHGREVECRFAIWAWWWICYCADDEDRPTWNQVAFVEHYTWILEARKRFEQEERESTLRARQAWAKTKASKA